MDEIILTADQTPAINPGRLAEDLEAALGAGAAVYAQHWRGVLIEARVRRVDGLPFTNDEVATVHAVAAAHDPALLSSDQAEAQAREAARDTALDNLARANMTQVQQDITNAAKVDALRGAALDLSDLVADVLTTIVSRR